MLNADPRFKRDRGQVSDWRIESRYESGVLEADAVEFVRKIADPQGILAWLTQYW